MENHKTSDMRILDIKKKVLCIRIMPGTPAIDHDIKSKFRRTGHAIINRFFMMVMGRATNGIVRTLIQKGNAKELAPFINNPPKRSKKSLLEKAQP